MEDILNGLNGRNVQQLVVGEFDGIQEPAPTLSQKTKGKLVLNKRLVHLMKLESVTPRNVVRLKTSRIFLN